MHSKRLVVLFGQLTFVVLLGLANEISTVKQKKMLSPFLIWRSNLKEESNTLVSIPDILHSIVSLGVGLSLTLKVEVNETSKVSQLFVTLIS